MEITRDAKDTAIRQIDRLARSSCADASESAADSPIALGGAR